jgi:pteridine reductase
MPEDTSETRGRPVALVTGAGRRIGAVVARYLAERGYSIALAANRSMEPALTTAEKLSAGGAPSIALAADMRDEQEVLDMVAAAHEHFGRIDALVNCAAIWEPKPLEEVRAVDVREHFEINALGTFLCCQQVGLIMAGQTDGGAIVNIGDWAIARPYAGYSAYFPSKGAIPTMTRMFAVELARRNPRVRVNAVLPGPVMLPEDLSQAERQASIAATLARREGRPENVAHAVLFLLQNDYVTGVCIPVDGGRGIFTADVSPE